MVKTLNVSIASENIQGKLAQTITGDDLIAEKGAFSISNDRGDQRIPFVYHPNFIVKVTDLVNQHDRQV